MKILILNSSDNHGGAARAAYRLHQGFLQQGMDSKMLVQRKDTSDPTVIGPENKVQRFIGLIRPTLDIIPLRKYKNKSKTPFSPSWLSNPWVLKKIKEINPDIINLHWVCGGFLSIKDIGKLKKFKKPIVWTLHDMWAFTGGEHCDQYQNHWMKSCGKSVVLGSNKEKDLSYKIWKKKNKHWSDLDMAIVAPSKWLGECVQKSSLLKNRKMEVIPNGLDIAKFKPIEKNLAREILNLPKNKKIVLFGGFNSTSDPNKGFLKLKEALERINLKNIHLVVFGNEGSEKSIIPDKPVQYVGKFFDDVSLQILYSAADIMVVPSLQEAFGQTISESMSCGTPVVAFDATGPMSLINHKVNGYLAKAFSSEDLAKGITWVLNESEKSNFLNINARNHATENFCLNKISAKYINLFKGK